MPDKKDIQYRSATIESKNKDNRTIELSFSSEDTIVPRWWGNERLSHEEGAVRLDRLNNGGPLLTDHGNDTSKQVGVIERAWIDKQTKKGRATVRFSKSARAEEIYQDVLDDIIVNVSTGYRVHNDRQQGDVILVTDWEPLEISLVSVPADTAVGVGRSADTSNEEEIIMPDTKPEEPKVETRSVEVTQQPPTVIHPDHTRIAELQYMGAALGCDRVMIQDFIANKKTAEELRVAYLEQRSAEQEKLTNPAVLDLSKKERKQYSLVRAIASKVPGLGVDGSFEMECSTAIEKRMNKQSKGFYIPYDIQNQSVEEVMSRSFFQKMGDYITGRNSIEQRAIQQVAVPNLGGYLVADDMLASSFIDILRSKLVVVELGATFLPGLVGNLHIPKQLTSVTAQWVPEGTAAAQSNMTFGQIALTPKTLAAQAEYTRLLLLQSTPGIEGLLRNDLAAVMARGIDKAVISGAGTAIEPQGIIGTAGVHSVVGGVLFEMDDAVAMMTAIANANAGFDNQAFLTTPTIAGAMMTRPQQGVTINQPLYYNNNLIGFRVLTTTQMPANTIIFGAWSQILIGEWGSLEIVVNPYGVNAPAGNVEIYAFQTIDVAVRYGQAFSIITDFV